MESGAGVGSSDEVTAELAAMLARFTALAIGPDSGDVAADADRIDRIALLEQIKSAAAAAPAHAVGALRPLAGRGAPRPRHSRPAAVGRGIGDQIALACRISPFRGSRRLHVALVLYFDLPGTRALLAAGQISEDTAVTVVSQTCHLDPEPRRQVDAQLCGRRDRAAVGTPRGGPGPEVRLRRGSGRLRRPGPHRPRRPPSHPAPGPGHDEPVHRVPAGGARSGLPGRAAPAHRRAARRPATPAGAGRSWRIRWSNASPGRPGRAT